MTWNHTLIHNLLITIRSEIRSSSELPENKDKIKDLFHLYNDFETCEKFIKSTNSDYHIKYTLNNLLNELENSYNIKILFDKNTLELLKN